MLPVQGFVFAIPHLVAGIPCLLMLDTQSLVQHRQGAVHQGDGVPGAQHEAVGEASARIPDVPAHHPAQQRSQEDVHL